MSFTRGFSGRGHANRDERLPPGQYDTGSEWPVLTAEVTPKLVHRHVDVHRRGSRRSTDHLDLGPAPRLPPSIYNGDIHCVTTWSKLA